MGGQQRTQDCDSALVITVYLYSCLGLSALGAVLAYWMSRVSQRGTIAHHQKRAVQSVLMTIWATFQLLGALFGGFGLALLIWSAPCGVDGDDDDELVQIMLAIVVAWQLFSACWITFLVYVTPHSSINREVEPHSGLSWKDKCRRGCRCLSLSSCCLFGGWDPGKRTGHVSMDPYQDAAEVLWELFGGQWRQYWYTPSDLAAGLGLVRAAYLSSKPRTAAPLAKYSRAEQADLDHAVVDMAHFSKYMLGIYGHLLFAYAEMFPPKGSCCCGILGYLKLCCHCRSGWTAAGDNCCGLHSSAFERRVLLDDSTVILYADFEGDICRTPYAICVDLEKKAVIVSIRGTISLKDCLTDGIAKPVPFEWPGQPNNTARRVHQGFYEAALVIRNELMKSKVLHALLKDKDVRPSSMDTTWLKKHATKLLEVVDEERFRDLASQTQGFKLVVVGHSLGAGVASVLTVLLHNKFNNIQGIAYSCPGAVFNKDLAQCAALQRLVTAVVLGDDMIPRLSLRSVERLRNRVIKSLEECDIHKVDILEASLEPSINMTPEWYTNPFSSSESQVIGPEMGIPGRIVYIQRQCETAEEEIQLTRDSLLLTFPKVCCGANEEDWVTNQNLTIRWAEQDEFTDIKCSPAMGLDHFPDRVFTVLLQLGPQCTHAAEYVQPEEVDFDDGPSEYHDVDDFDHEDPEGSGWFSSPTSDNSSNPVNKV